MWSQVLREEGTVPHVRDWGPGTYRAWGWGVKDWGEQPVWMLGTVTRSLCGAAGVSEGKGCLCMRTPTSSSLSSSGAFPAV